MKTAQVTVTDDGTEFAVRTPYDRELIEDLKDALPWQARRWDKPEKAWFIKVAWRITLEAVLDRHFDEIIYNDGEDDTAVEVFEGGPYRTLFLYPDAPDEVVKAVYRVLAIQHYPDHGGSDKEMAELNAAYQQIRKERNS